jgi:iron complex transport system ATP-binding protein
MLQATDVWFGYDAGKTVLRGVSVAVPRSGIIGILGPNGSGKTTLLRLLAGTRHPQRGSVTLDEAPLTRFSRAALARRMAVVPQETQLAFDYTVSEVAMMGRYPHLGPFEIEGPADLAVVEETLKSTGTLHLKDRLYATLSGGEKQRVVIAAALAQIFRLKAEATG